MTSPPAGIFCPRCTTNLYNLEPGPLSHYKDHEWPTTRWRHIRVEGPTGDDDSALQTCRIQLYNILFPAFCLFIFPGNVTNVGICDVWIPQSLRHPPGAVRWNNGRSVIQSIKSWHLNKNYFTKIFDTLHFEEVYVMW